tara:strand:+ start:30266 stop:30703 length:438 start_codon:yes stop_codon:yes gene_type:complete
MTNIIADPFEVLDPQSFFVYGTLRTDLNRVSIDTDVSVIGSASMQNSKMYDAGAYPAVTESDNPNDRVHGQVISYEHLDDADWELRLRMLDLYEGVPNLYQRELVTVDLDDGQSVIVWTYIYNRPTDSLNPIDGGDWKEWSAPKN